MKKLVITFQPNELKFTFNEIVEKVNMYIIVCLFTFFCVCMFSKNSNYLKK